MCPGCRSDLRIDVIEWRYSPVVEVVPAAAAARRPSNRKSRPSLLDNGVSRIGCEKASPADSLGSEYFRRCDFNEIWRGRCG